MGFAWCGEGRVRPAEDREEPGTLQQRFHERAGPGVLRDQSMMMKDTSRTSREGPCVTVTRAR
jgi:hypothetical protein